MTRVTWGAPGAKQYETGLDRGMLYPFSAGLVVDAGVAWNGLVSVTENVSGGEVESYYYDGVKYMDLILYEDFEATLEAFNAPPEFAPCDGTRQVALGLFATQQPRKPFHLCYRTGLYSDTSNGVPTPKLHLLYNLMVAPAERVRKTLNADAEMPSISWSLYGRPPKAGVYGGATYKPTAHLTLDESKLTAAQITGIEDRLYGTAVAVPVMPTQQELVTYINTGAWV